MIIIIDWDPKMTRWMVTSELLKQKRTHFYYKNKKELIEGLVKVIPETQQAKKKKRKSPDSQR